MLCWIRVGLGWPRLELFGSVVQLDANAPGEPPSPMLATLRAIRIRNQQAQVILLMELAQIRFDELISLAGELPAQDDDDGGDADQRR